MWGKAATARARETGKAPKKKGDENAASPESLPCFPAHQQVVPQSETLKSEYFGWDAAGIK